LISFASLTARLVLEARGGSTDILVLLGKYFGLVPSHSPNMHVVGHEACRDNVLPNNIQLLWSGHDGPCGWSYRKVSVFRAVNQG
jgi:hypothetical protein